MLLDVRGPRFTATVTTAVLITILLTGNGLIAAAQALIFAAGALSARHAPYGLVFRRFIAPRLAPPQEFEPAQPVRFAQGVGFAFAATAAAGYLGGAPLVGLVATALALVAALLNAAFGVCLGCEAYLALRRVFGPRTATAK